MPDKSSTPPRDSLPAAQPGDLIPGSRDADPDAEQPDDTNVPEQEEFFRSPARFGSVPVDEFPLGWDRRLKFNKVYPYVSLPTQVVERVTFGHPELPPNRLLWGDNLHVMRQLPSESIDLIYIDPPFFSGRHYNVIFGDQNEIRSFTDIWDAGLPGYLEWLNARLFEMKRLLKSTGSIYVHLDWHAVHYVKTEMDKIFGYENFLNNIVWTYRTRAAAKQYWNRKHDDILVYRKSAKHYFNWQAVMQPLSDTTIKKYRYRDDNGSYRLSGRGITGSPIRSAKDVDPSWEKTHPELVVRDYLRDGMPPPDYIDVDIINQVAKERLGYPTQKPEALIERFVAASSKPGDTVADFFVGGGTLPAVAQRLGRRWVVCDQSRVAIAVTADRAATQAEQLSLDSEKSPVPDFTVEHWGTYEAARLSQAPADQFRNFIIDAAQLRRDAAPDGLIHAFRGQLPVWIGPPDRNYRVTPKDVVDFANAVRRLDTFRQGMLREARMIAWAFSPAAQEQAASISAAKHSSNNYLDIELVRIESDAFREHIIRLSSEKADYSTFLTFVRPPEVVVGKRNLGGRTWRFDVGDTLVTNTDARLINVQWDFDYRDDRFTSSLPYKDLRSPDGSPKTVVDWTFPRSGRFTIACKLQDDLGGEGFHTEDLLVN